MWSRFTLQSGKLAHSSSIILMKDVPLLAHLGRSISLINKHFGSAGRGLTSLARSNDCSLLRPSTGAQGSHASPSEVSVHIFMIYMCLILISYLECNIELSQLSKHDAYQKDLHRKIDIIRTS